MFPGSRLERMSHGESARPAPRVTLLLPCSSDDSKSSSPEPVTHLKWDDPYYDIARHQIVEVAGKHAGMVLLPLYFVPLASRSQPLLPPRKGTFCT